MATRQENIAIVIVNYRTPDLVIAGIQAIEKEQSQFANVQVIIVDNLSDDGSATQLDGAVETYEWQTWVTIIRAERNGGFAYGNNIGFQFIENELHKTDYLWMLNPDTEITHDAIAPLVDFLKNNPRCIVGSRLQDRDGKPQHSAFNFPSVTSEMCSGFTLGILDKLFAKHIVRRTLTQEQQQVDWLAGASVMMTMETYRELGMMDEEYFLYYEEVDYLLRAKRKGIHCWLIPTSRIIHEIGAATGISDERKKQPRRPQYWFESRRRYFVKNHGRLKCFLADTLWLIGRATWLIRKAIVRDQHYQKRPPRLWRDFLKHSQVNACNWKKPYDLK